MWMLDTNICIALIRHRPPPLVAQLRARAVGEIGISTITLAELQHGVCKSAAPARNRDALLAFLAPLEILPFDHEAAIQYGELRADLERRGLPIGAMDLLIGAHALARKATLVTNNTREFTRIGGLSVEDWTV